MNKNEIQLLPIEKKTHMFALQHDIDSFQVRIFF